jgi:L,D-transpeptidase YbiS
MHIKISIAEQKLHLYRDDNLWVKSFVISTAEKGTGQNKGSFCTPLGQHIVRAKIGQGAPLYAQFAARRLTGKIWHPSMSEQHERRLDFNAHPLALRSRDWI